MDPDAAWATILDPASTHLERAQAALGLLAWLASEGFLPTNIDVGRTGVVEVCKAAVEIALEQSSSRKEPPRIPLKGGATLYVRLPDLDTRELYRVECSHINIEIHVAVWDGRRFIVAAANRLTDSMTPGDGITKGQIKALEWIGTLPSRIELRIANNKPLFNYLTSLEREHGSESRGVGLHPG